MRRCCTTRRTATGRRRRKRSSQPAITTSPRPRRRPGCCAAARRCTRLTPPPRSPWPTAWAATSWSPTGLTPKPRKCSAASSCSRRPTWTRRANGPRRSPPPGAARSSSARWCRWAGRVRARTRERARERVTPQEQLAETVRIEGRRVLATLIRVLGDMQLAEDAVQEAAFGWPAPSSVPDVAEEVLEMTSPDSAVRDDMLRLGFTCCHPALAREAQVALALRTIAGLEAAAIARANLVPEATMAKRLVRARQKIKHAQIPYRVPSDAELPERLPAVLAVVHLIFTEAHAPSAGDDVLAVDLAAEAVRLARLLNEL